jgi:acyl-ACP thioesterase
MAKPCITEHIILYYDLLKEQSLAAEAVSRICQLILNMHLNNLKCLIKMLDNIIVFILQQPAPCTLHRNSPTSSAAVQNDSSERD